MNPKGGGKRSDNQTSAPKDDNGVTYCWYHNAGVHAPELNVKCSMKNCKFSHSLMRKPDWEKVAKPKAKGVAKVAPRPRKGVGRTAVKA